MQFEKINEEILYTLESDVLKTGINLNFIPSHWNVCPYVYFDDNGNILLDLSYSRQAVMFDEKGVGINKDYQIIPQLWKVSSDFKSAEKIDDKTSADWKYVNKQAEFIKAEHDKAKNFIGEKGSVSKNQDDMQKHFKIKYKDFTVPDSEESLSVFFEDSYGNLFNYGNATVYDERAKRNISTRNRSYMNIYSKHGTKPKTVKFKGYPIYIFQREHRYYVVTQQDKSGKSQAKLRLYFFKYNEI